jgi:hypothetical protein
MSVVQEMLVEIDAFIPVCGRRSTRGQRINRGRNKAEALPAEE